MLDITGAGAQLPMRSHWKLRPGPQSHKNSEQQCKRIRASTATANSKASATRQAAQQPQPAPLSRRKRTHEPCAAPSATSGADGERRMKGRARERHRRRMRQTHSTTSCPPLPSLGAPLVASAVRVTCSLRCPARRGGIALRGACVHPGHVLLTAPLPFDVRSDGGYSSRFNIYASGEAGAEACVSSAAPSAVTTARQR